MNHPAGVAERVLKLATRDAPGADVEVSVDRTQLALTRFAGSAIHQNVADDTVGVQVRVHRDGRTASASTTRVDDDGLRALVERTLASVAVAPVDPGWPGVASAAPLATVAPVDAATASASPADRAAVVAAFVDAAGGLETAGYCRTSHWTGAFANSGGQAVAGERAEAGVDAIARMDGADGVARAASSRLADLDGAVLGARAAAKAIAATEPVELAPDRFEVVLEPTAVADLLTALSWFAFNAKAVAERRSFVRLGEAQFDPAITLVDDAPAVGDPYDAEGTPHQRVVLVQAGTATSLTYDRRTAAEAGVASTGHSVGAPAFGGIGRQLALQASADDLDPSEVEGPIVDAAAAQLVAGVERGILVTDLWYTRVLDPRTLALTGLTRNGVWLIEGGQLARPVGNLRFTQSYAEALSPGRVLGVGAVAHAVPGDTYTATPPRWTAPALHLASWNFTGGASG